MPQNTNVPQAGTQNYPSQIVDPNQQPVVHVVPEPNAVNNSQGPVRYSPPPLPPQNPDIQGDDPALQAPPEPPPWTDEDYVQYANSRYGGKFTPRAARAFSEFDHKSHDIQAAEFYRFTDEEYEKHGYF